MESLRSCSQLLNVARVGYWCSKAKSSVGLAAGGKLRAAKEDLVQSGKVAAGQTVELDTRKRRLLAIPSGDTIAQITGVAGLVFNWPLLTGWGSAKWRCRTLLRKTERQWR